MTTPTSPNNRPIKPALPKPEKPAREPRIKFNTALLIFLGTLLGSLIGAAADLGGAADTVDRIRQLFYPELCVTGSNTILGDGITMAADWEAEFEATNNAKVTIDGIGSVRGVEKAAGGGCVHILAMSEPMTPAQYDSLVNAGINIDCAAEIGYDVIAFVTDKKNPATNINISDLDEVLTGGIDNWANVGGQRGALYSQPIYILARSGSGTTEVVLVNVAGYSDPNLNDDQYFPPGSNYLSCPSNEACLDLTLSTPGSLYWVSSAWMRTQPPEYLRVIPILEGDEAPINPLEQDVNLEEYPSRLIRPLYFYVLGGEKISADANRLARDFLNYARSVKGQQILERYYFYTHFDKPTEIRIPLPEGFMIPNSGPRVVCRDAA